MDQDHLTFLGTGTSQGVPVIACDCPVCRSIDFRDKRLRSSVLFHINGKNIAVDTGPDFRQQMLSNRVKQLDAVIYTHAHKDHTAGMDDVRSFNFKQQRDMPLFAEPPVVGHLKKAFDYAFAEKKYPGVPKVKVNEINHTKPFWAEGIQIQPIRALHYKLPVLGFRIKNTAYLTDANHIDEQELEKLQGLETFVVNGLQKKPHISHFTLQEAIELSQNIKAKKTYITHISHHLGKHHDVSAELPDNVQLAYDNLRIPLL